LCAGTRSWLPKMAKQPPRNSRKFSTTAASSGTLDRRDGKTGVARANALQAKTLQRADADASCVRALGAYKDFLTLWRDADTDVPNPQASQSGIRQAPVASGVIRDKSCTSPAARSYVPVRASSD
jgi:hypothetical protein